MYVWNCERFKNLLIILMHRFYVDLPIATISHCSTDYYLRSAFRLSAGKRFQQTQQIIATLVT